MGNRKTSFIEGEFYHIYNRGNSKQKIFHNNEDYKRFIGLLYACNQDKAFKILNLSKNQSLYDLEIVNNLIAIGCYVLMPNHFHLLVVAIAGGDISKFMQKVITAYVMYYNKKYKRTGGLFEGTFKAQHVTNNTHFQYLFAYIHLNILKLVDPLWKKKGFENHEKVIKYLKEYVYSSLPDYLGVKRVENKVINKTYFPFDFSTVEELWKSLFNWVQLG